MPFVYGEVVPGGGEIGDVGHLPTIIHPTEVFDGALVNSWSINACMRDTTYLLQNHAVIENLYARHGRDLNFGGVVLYTNGDSVETKERISSYAANVARQLRADGVILNYLGGGHSMVDVMLVCQKLEQHGIRTTLLLMEMADQPEDPGFVHFVREADAIVSTGNYEQTIELPRVDRVLGGSKLLPTGEDARGPLELTLRRVLAATNQYGGSSLRGRTY
jgi:glycine reductase